MALFITVAPPPAAAKELQWRRGRPPGTQAASQAKSQPRRDTAVRQAAWDDIDDEPLQLHPNPGQARLRSIVVDRDAEDLRSAQLPWEEEDDSQLEEQLRTPFDTPELDDSLDFDTTTPPVQPDRQPTTRDTTPRRMQPPVTPLDDVYGLDADVLAREREEAQSVCSQELADLRKSTLHEVNISIAVTGTEGEDYPFECSIDDGTWLGGRCWPQTVYMWKASALCHKPLYFENVQLERYGHSWGPFCQPFVSGAHFFTRLPVLPYCMGVEPPNECIYALGHYRPGSCAPYMIDPIPISGRGAIFQAAAVTGTVFVVP